MAGRVMAVQYDGAHAAAAVPAREEDERVRVMVIDGHRVFAEALARAIDDARQMRCVAIATSGDNAARLARECEPDVVVVDVPGGAAGREATRAVCDQHPGLRVLVLTGPPVPSVVRMELVAVARERGFSTRPADSSRRIAPGHVLLIRSGAASTNVRRWPG